MPEGSAQDNQYKIRLDSGRVLGPIGLDRIVVLIKKNKITGHETARLYPKGSWKDINQFPEIAELFLQNFEGQFGVKTEGTKPIETEPEFNFQMGDVPVDAPKVYTPQAEEKEEPLAPDESTKVMPKTGEDAEATVIATQQIQMDPEKSLKLTYTKREDTEQESKSENPALQYLDTSKPSSRVMAEATQMIKLKNSPDPAFLKKKEPKRIFSPKMFSLMVGLVAFIVILDTFDTGKTKPTENPVEIPFKLELPVVDKAKFDPQKSETFFKSGFSYYTLDTVDGYKMSYMLFAKAIQHNGENIPALSLAASSLINLVDVIKSDDKYYQIIVTLLEAIKAKNVTLIESIVAEVEFFLVQRNADAALRRIDEYSKIQMAQGKNDIPAQLFYYLALTFFITEQYNDAIKNLDLIKPEQWFSSKIPHLYGAIFEVNGDLDKAVMAYETVLKKSPNHVKARAALADIFLKKGDFSSAGKQAGFVIKHKNLASARELSKSLYIRGKMLGGVQKNDEGLADLDAARKLDPDNIDILLEYYTVRARISNVGDQAKKSAKVYELLAQGELALKENQLQPAMKFFMAARREDDKNPQPLMRIAEVFKRQDQSYNAMKNYEKALALAPQRAEIYSLFVKSAVDAYEFLEAEKGIKKFISLNPQPSPSAIDKLNGYLSYKKENYKDAVAYFKRAQESTSTDADIFYYIAECLQRAQSHQYALFYYGLARRLDPARLEIISGTAFSLSENDGVEKAIEFLKKEIGMARNKVSLYNILASFLAKKNNYEDAMKLVNESLGHDDKYYPLYKTKAEILQGQDRLKEALGEYDSYLAFHPNDPKVRIEKYKMTLKQMDFVQARKEINLLLGSFPKYPGAHVLLGKLALEAQNASEAYREAELELKNNPNHLEALVLSGNALNMAGEYIKALERLNGALAVEPSFVPALLGAGFANHKLKSYAAAQTLLERAVKIDSGNPMIHKRLGSLYFDMGNRASALQHYRAYIDLFPDAPDRAEVEKILQ